MTTARLTHATPGALYAHNNDRYHECDTKFELFPEPPPEGAHDIAWQLVHESPGNKAKVLLGGGYPAFFPKEMEQAMRNFVRLATRSWYSL